LVKRTHLMDGQRGQGRENMVDMGGDGQGGWDVRVSGGCCDGGRMIHKDWRGVGRGQNKELKERQ